jgi:phosphatidylglycerol:prolipoprotein diacylglycerol transferase
MHPFLLELPGFRLPTYGVLSLFALLVAILLVRRYARIEGLAVARTTEAIVLTIAVGYFGARIVEAVLHWDRYFGTPGGLKLLLHSTGAFLGGLVVAIPFCILWFRHIGLPVLQGLDILAMAGCVAEGVGRWGCFFSGCCYGTPTDLPWAVTFPEVARRLHAGLPDVPIHPTQIYMSIDAFLILGALVMLYRRKRFHGQIVSAYVFLYTLTRFFVEFVRGDADRGAGLVSSSQVLGLLLSGIAAGSYLYLDARHRRSHEPDWRPQGTA